MTASVWFDPKAIPGELLAALDDSKRLTALMRETLAKEIWIHAKVGVAASSPRVIDIINIRQATLSAMKRSILKVGVPGPVFIDGRDVPAGLPWSATAVVKGDQLIPQIAAASIVAKVMRDNLLAKLGSRHPAYGWATNAGYGVKSHLEAINALGPTKHHRMTFAPLATPAQINLFGNEGPDLVVA